jgi:hypothetical protein
MKKKSLIIVLVAVLVLAGVFAISIVFYYQSGGH